MTAILTVLGTVSAFAAEKLDKDMSGSEMTLAERLEYALQGSATGMIMVFAVLGLLAVVLYLSKVVFYDIPNKKKAEQSNEKSSESNVPVANTTSAPVQTVTAASAATASGNDGELAAVITAAIAAMIESGDYKNEFVGGFRVVSFKRSTSGAWNRK